MNIKVWNLESVFSEKPDAVSIIKGSEKYPEISGAVLFYQTEKGVIVRTEVSGLPENSEKCGYSIFACHIHGGGSCTGNAEDPFADANGHYNPNNCPHPAHSGDMPPLFGDNGEALSVFLTGKINVAEIKGKTVIIHASADDFKSQPAGNSGEKIACGVIF